MPRYKGVSVKLVSPIILKQYLDFRGLSFQDLGDLPDE